MRERPIIFSADQVRAVLAGSKTQHRVPVKPRPPTGFHQPERGPGGGWAFVRERAKREWHDVTCPFGQPGDQLIVKESFRIHSGRDARIEYCAGGVWESKSRNDRERLALADTMPMTPAGVKAAEAELRGERHRPIKRPAGHLPRWASRITLEIVGVRVEQDISPADAKAEWVWVIDFKPLPAPAAPLTPRSAGKGVPR